MEIDLEIVLVSWTGLPLEFDYLRRSVSKASPQLVPCLVLGSGLGLGLRLALYLVLGSVLSSGLYLAFYLVRGLVLS